VKGPRELAIALPTRLNNLARWRGIRWWIPLLAFPAVVVLTWDVYWVLRQFINMAVAWDRAAVDFHHLASAAAARDPYAVETYRWSPVAIWALMAITPLGITAWRAAQLVTVLTLRDWRAIAFVLVSAPFWMDVTSGQAMTFVTVAAWHALRGSRIGTWIFLAFCVLMPRPLMLPVLAWLLWKRADLRLGFAVLVVAHGIAVLATGFGPDWVARLLASSSELRHVNNLAPSRFIGVAWVPIGLVIAGWLTWRGRLGLASLAASPYVFPYYLLMLILELIPRRVLVGDRRSERGLSRRSVRGLTAS
jgi:hypothetical protein